MDELERALFEDGEKLRQMTGQEHGPFCPRCLVNPADPVLLGRDGEGHVCDQCWESDRAADEQST